MSELRLVAVSARPLRRISLTLREGCHVLRSSDAAASGALALVASGLRRPRTGRVLFDGQPIQRTPAARRRITTLLRHESLPPAERVGDAVALALALRGSGASAGEVLGALGLGAWGPRPPEDLDPSEVRAVALALALAPPRAELLVAVEPLECGWVDPARVVLRMHALATEGSVVLCIGAGPTLERIFGRAVAELSRGGSVELPAADASASSADRGHFTARMHTEQARALAAALGACPAVSAVEWGTPRVSGEVLAWGEDPDALSLAVLRAAHDHGVVLDALSIDAAEVTTTLGSPGSRG